MDFISEELLDYVTQHSHDEPQILKELTRETYQKILLPRMLSGPLQGRFLSMLSKLLRPKKILEIGTYTGYATLCLAEGLDRNGTIDTLDKNEELVDLWSGKVTKQADPKDKDTQVLQKFNKILATDPRIESVLLPLRDGLTLSRVR